MEKNIKRKKAGRPKSAQKANCCGCIYDNVRTKTCEKIGHRRHKAGSRYLCDGYTKTPIERREKSIKDVLQSRQPSRPKPNTLPSLPSKTSETI
jgi:hypothetical protein